MNTFLHEFKLEMLNYLGKKLDLLCTCPRSDIVFNSLTLEVIKVVYMLLQFGLFKTKPKSTKTLDDMEHGGTDKRDHNNKNDIERLVNYMAVLLEYDE